MRVVRDKYLTVPFLEVSSTLTLYLYKIEVSHLATLSSIWPKLDKILGFPKKFHTNISDEVLPNYDLIQTLAANSTLCVLPIFVRTSDKFSNIQTIDDYKKLEEELQKHGFSMESPHKLVSVLLKINPLGYDALKLVKELARIKSIKQTERILNKNCTLESRNVRLKEILPMCEQVMKLGIGFSELVAFPVGSQQHMRCGI